MSALPKSGEVYYADDGTMSIVLEDTFDPNYEPPEKEVHDYAKWLGIDVDTEKELLWIARDGLKAPLPSEWKPCKTDTGDVYYFNFKTGDSIWDHPMDDIYKKRVEDERAKLKSGSGGGKAGSSAASKLVKGGAGNVEEKGGGRIASVLGGGPTTAGAGRTAIEESRPRMGRLGAIGSTDDAKPLRPDISDLIPTKGEQAATALFGKKKEPLKDFKELERNFRKKYDSEFAAQQATLQEKHSSTLTELETKLANELRSAKNNAKTDLEDEVEAARRNGERRNKRELGLYEDSVEKQKEDLRRTLRTLQEKLDSDSHAVQRRVESELAEKRSATERNMAAEIGRTRKEIQDRWQAEKMTAELHTQNQLRELRNSHELKIDVIRQEEARALSQRIVQLQDALSKEMDAARQEIQAQRNAQSQRLRDEAAQKDSVNAAALHAANEAHNSAIQAANAAAAAAIRSARDDASRAMDAARSEFQAKKQAVERDALLQGQQTAAEAQASRRQAAERRVADFKAEQTRAMDEARRAYDAETATLVAEAQRQAASSAEEVAKLQETARQGRLVQLQQAHESRMASLRQAHAERMQRAATAGQSPAVQAELQTRLQDAQRKWQSDNPAPVLILPSLGTVPTFDASSITVEPIIVRQEVEAPPTAEQIAALVKQEVLAVQASLEADHQRRRDELEESLKKSYEDEVRQHREKALADVETRLELYRQQGGSPLRASKSQQSSYSAPVAALSSSSSEKRIPLAQVNAEVQTLRTILQGQLDALQKSLQQRLSNSFESLQRADTEMQAAQSAVAAAAAAAAAAGSHGQPMSRPPLAAHQQQPPFPGAVGLPLNRPPSASGIPLSPTMAHSQRAASPNNGFGPSGAQHHNSLPASPMLGGSRLPHPSPSSIAQQQHQHHHHHSSNHSTPLRQREGYGSQPVLHYGGGEDGLFVSAGGRPRSADFEERLKKAHDILRRKKRDFKEKQAHLEQLRADWKRDMAKAKSRRDVDTVQTLMDVLDVLEADARRINKEAVSLKQSYAWLKKEEEKYSVETAGFAGSGSGGSPRFFLGSQGGPYAQSQPSQSRPGSAMGPHMSDLNYGATHTTTGAAAMPNSAVMMTEPPPTMDLLSMLQTMMQRVDSVEALLQRQSSSATRQRHATPTAKSAAAAAVGVGSSHHQKVRSSSAGRRGSDSDPVTGRWTSWLQEQGHSSRVVHDAPSMNHNNNKKQPLHHRDPLMMEEDGAAAGSPKKRDVEMWLREQQQRHR